MPETEFVGFFGFTHKSTLENITLEAINVRGRSQVGGLIGYNNNSNVYNCSVSGKISGGEWFIGGLVGTNYGEIKNSHAKISLSSVAGETDGLVGSNHGNIINCYAIIDGSVGAHSGNNISPMPFTIYQNILNKYRLMFSS